MKRTPLKRRVSLRDSTIRKLREERTHRIWKPNGKIARKRPLKKWSRSMREKLKAYYPVQRAFLDRDENRLCEICRRRREAGENIRQNESVEVHHKFGRGKRLSDETGFIASCRSCRLWPHENPRQARDLGLLA